MNDPANPEASSSDAKLTALYARALPRMLRVMLVVSIPLIAPAYWS